MLLPEVIIMHAPSMQSLAAKTTHLSLSTVLITLNLTAMIQTKSIYKYIKSMLAVSLKNSLRQIDPYLFKLAL